MLFILIVFIIVIVAIVVISYRKDRHYVKKKTVESIGDNLWDEIEKEREESVERGKSFRKILKRAKKTGEGRS